MAITYHDLKFNTRRALAAAGLEEPEQEAQEMLCAASGKGREELLRDLDLYMNDDIAQQVEEMVRRRCEGEPLAYVLGQWPFRELTLEVGPHVLIPRQETEILVQLAVDRLQEYDGPTRVLDLCSGSGCVGLSIAAEVPTARVVLMEASDLALDVCRRNVRRNRLSIRAVHMKGDALAEPKPNLGLFDVLVCNPPYIPTGDIGGLDIAVRDYEPRMALDGGADGLEFYRNIAAKWKNAIRLGGSLIFEVGIGQAPDVEKIMAENGFESIQTTADTQGIWRVVEGTINN